jgi:hypothetical protein
MQERRNVTAAKAYHSYLARFWYQWKRLMIAGLKSHTFMQRELLPISGRPMPAKRQSTPPYTY